MIDVAHERDDRSSRSELFYFLDEGRWRLFDHDLSLVDACPFFALLNFENKSVLSTNRSSRIRFDRVIDRRENVHLHQIVNQLEGLESDLLGKLANDDRRLDVNDFVAIHSGCRF